MPKWFVVGDGKHAVYVEAETPPEAVRIVQDLGVRSSFDLCALLVGGTGEMLQRDERAVATLETRGLSYPADFDWLDDDRPGRLA